MNRIMIIYTQTGANELPRTKSPNEEDPDVSSGPGSAIPKNTRS